MNDKGINKYDPHIVANTKYEAIINHRKAKRMFNSLTRIREEKIKMKYLHYRFLTNEKHSVEDAKAKAFIDKEVTEINPKLQEAEELMDEAYAELERVTEKIEQMRDHNATARAEMKLGGLTP